MIRPPFSLWLTATLLFTWTGQTRLHGAEETTPTAQAEQPPQPRLFGRVRGLFDVDLPRFDPPGTFRLDFNPRVADLIRRDYIRVPTGVRWTVNDRLEFNVEVEAYATHGLDSDSSAGYGIGKVRFGARRLLSHWPKAGLETNVGLNLDFPVGSPPADLTDGLNRLSPFLVTQRRLDAHPKWTIFGGGNADFVADSSVPGRVDLNTPRDDSLSVNAGAIYDLGQIKWTLQATYTNTWISAGDAHFLTIRPSVLWFVPRRFTFSSKTQWTVGIGVRSTWGPDGYELSTGTRVRAELAFRQALRRLRGN